MSGKPEIRSSTHDDRLAIEALYPVAFPDEDLLPLVSDLLGHPGLVTSLVATLDSQIAGHVIFTRCGLVDDGVNASLLAPLAVAPARQGHGIGSALVRAGLQRLRDAGVACVYVLGDPAFYQRFGFMPEASVEPPYPIPPEWQPAWQSLDLRAGDGRLTGRLDVPEPWRKPELWAP